MSKQSNRRMHPDLNQVRRELEAIMNMGHHAATVYEDWIGLMFYVFQRDDPHYLEIMDRYPNTAPTGRREADHFAYAMAALLEYMASTHDEALGPLFMEFASSRYQGQFFTPLSLARTMAAITLTSIPEGRRFSVADTSCGAGACLVAAAKEMTFEQNNRAFFVGQDISLNCARMAALNMMFFNLDALIVWGNSLTLEVRGAWETKRSVAFGGSLRPADTEKARAWIAGAFQAQEKPAPCVKTDTKTEQKMEQLLLF